MMPALDLEEDSTALTASKAREHGKGIEAAERSVGPHTARLMEFYSVPIESETTGKTAGPHNANNSINTNNSRGNNTKTKWIWIVGLLTIVLVASIIGAVFGAVVAAASSPSPVTSNDGPVVLPTPAPSLSSLLSPNKGPNLSPISPSTMEPTFPPSFKPPTFPPTNAITQMGSDIDGEAAQYYFGYSVAMSSDGRRVTAGAIMNGVHGHRSGHVRVFGWDGTGWEQLGSDIDGEATWHHFGESVAMSSDGSRIAIGGPGHDGSGQNSGHVKVFDWSGTDWQQVGSDVDGEAAYDYFGRSVSMSSDGSRIAVGSDRNGGNGVNSGHVRVFDWSGTDWQQAGSDIDGEAADDYFSESVAMSSDGSRIAIGGTGNDGNGDRSGHVRVFDWGGTGWQQLGSDIDGEAAEDRFGESVAMSSDGSRIAVGAAYNDGNGIQSGHVRVFDWGGTDWRQLGSDIDGEYGGIYFGVSVTMSSDGSRIAAGAHHNRGSGQLSGHVRVFDWTGTDWEQFGSDIDGEAANNYSGSSVAISSDGNHLAVGAWGNSDNGQFSGHVRVFSLGG